MSKVFKVRTFTNGTFVDELVTYSEYCVFRGLPQPRVLDLSGFTVQAQLVQLPPNNPPPFKTLNQWIAAPPKLYKTPEFELRLSIFHSSPKGMEALYKLGAEGTSFLLVYDPAPPWTVPPDSFWMLKDTPKLSQTAAMVVLNVVLTGVAKPHGYP